MNKLISRISGLLLIGSGTYLLCCKFSCNMPLPSIFVLETVNPLLFLFLFVVGIYLLFKKIPKDKHGVKSIDHSRRNFLTFAATLAQDEGMHAIQNKMSKGVAAFTGKRNSKSSHPVLPAGTLDFEQFKNKCNSCLACVENCPDHIIEPTMKIGQGLLPVLNFTNGFCNPNCLKCNNVCTSNAINEITLEEKKKIQIGHAIWLRENCMSITQGKECRICMEACPNKCIEIIQNGRKSYPIIDNSKCTGCGACEHNCPANPLKGIYVEAFVEHKEILDF